MSHEMEWKKNGGTCHMACDRAALFRCFVLMITSVLLRAPSFATVILLGITTPLRDIDSCKCNTLMYDPLLTGDDLSRPQLLLFSLLVSIFVSLQQNFRAARWSTRRDHSLKLCNPRGTSNSLRATRHVPPAKEVRRFLDGRAPVPINIQN